LTTYHKFQDDLCTQIGPSSEVVENQPRALTTTPPSDVSQTPPLCDLSCFINASHTTHPHAFIRNSPSPHKQLLHTSHPGQDAGTKGAPQHAARNDWTYPLSKATKKCLNRDCLLRLIGSRMVLGKVR
jgi:hypothetical protein